MRRAVVASQGRSDLLLVEQDMVAMCVPPLLSAPACLCNPGCQGDHRVVECRRQGRFRQGESRRDIQPEKP